MINSRVLRVVLACLAAFILLTGAFCLGINVGERKAHHFAGWMDNYDRAFGHRPPEGFKMMPLEPAPFPGGHGVFGKVISVSGSNLVIQGPDAVEQDVTMTTSTQIRAGRDTIPMGDIRPDMDAAVFGAPNGRGQIDARLIRLFYQPNLPAPTSTK